MADPPDGIQGLLGNLFPGNDPAALYGGALTDPATRAQMANRGLLAMAGSFADSAMPTRMPTPLGAVLGHAAAALGTSGDAVMQARLQESQSEQARATAYLATQTGGVRGMLPDLIKGYMTAGGDGGGIPSVPAPAAAAAPGAGSPTSVIPFDELAAGVKGSWFGNSPGWEDKSDSGLQASGLPVAGNPGIALPIPKSSPLFGRLYNVTTPDGRTFQLRQTDYGPAGSTGRGVDINSEAAKVMSYTPKTFPTDGTFKVELAADQGPEATQTAAAPGGLLDLADPTGATGRMNASIPGVADNAAPPPLGPGGSPTANLLATTLPPGAAGAPLPPPLPPPGGAGPGPGGPPAPAGPNLMPGGAMQQPGLLGPQPQIPSANIPPPSLVPQPAPAAPVLPPARPQPPPQVATAPPPAAPAPGTMSGVPSPEKIAAAKKLVLAWSLSGLGPVPATVAADAAWDTDTAKAVREAQIKLGFAGPTAAATKAAEFPYTWGRPGGVLPGPGGSFTVAPTLQPGPPDAQGNPTQRYISMGPSGAVAVPVPGASGPSPQEAAFGTAVGKNIAELGPTNPMGAPAPSPGAAAKEPTASPYGMLPPTSEEKLPTSAKLAESAIPLWNNRIDDWTKAIQPAQQAEMRMMTIADAFKSIQTGKWATEGAAITGALAGIGIHLDPSIANDPAKVQLVLHENILSTLPILKAATRNPTQTEFVTTTESREHPNIQPEANLQMLGEDIAIMRQAQNLPAAFYASGWQNPLQFEQAYYRHNPASSAVPGIKKEIGQLRGMPGWTPPAGSPLLPAQPAVPPSGASLPTQSAVPAPGAKPATNFNYNPRTNRLEAQ